MISGVAELFYQLVLLFISIFFVNYVCIPGYHYLGNVGSHPMMDRMVTNFDRYTGYNLYYEHTSNMWVLCAFGGYITMGIICAILDSVVPISFKTQGSRSFCTTVEWFQALRLSLFNLFVTSWIVSIPIAAYYKTWPRSVQQHDPINISVEACNFVVFIVVVEVWFYITHLMLHLPVLYLHIHKLHHRFKAPVAVASMYAHPVEFAVGNLLGVILGPVLTGAHPITSYVWIFFALMGTGGSHSGYKMFHAQFHDDHHKYFDYNYGIGGSIDKLLGTCWEGSTLWRKVNKKD